MHPALRRELRVAFSLRAQPLWFRIIKWIIFLTLVVLFWRSVWFWRCVAAALVIAVALHLFYRHKTRRWTRPWGGWNDLDAGRDVS